MSEEKLAQTWKGDYYASVLSLFLTLVLGRLSGDPQIREPHNRHEQRAIAETLSDSTRHGDLKFRIIAESAVDCIFLKNDQRRYTYVNGAMQRLLGLGEQEILGKRPEEIFDPESAEKIREVDDGTFSGKVINEVRSVAVQGIEKEFHTIQVPLTNDEGDVVEICGIVRDVTDRKNCENQLRASVKEKEILLREVNHRVNNNLQMITGLISLQTRRAESPEARDALRDIQGKIGSIWTIHRKLFRKDNSALIDFGSFLEDLLTTLVQTFDRPEIRVEIRCPDLTIPIGKAIPLAIMVNEMATNTIKHAFPERQPGLITVDCTARPGEVSLVVGDSGRWRVPEAGPGTGEGLGMQMIREMISQLNGTLTLVRQPRTRFEILIPHADGDDGE